MTGKQAARLAAGVLAVSVASVPFGIAMCSVDGRNTLSTVHTIALFAVAAWLSGAGGWLALSTLWKVVR